MILAIMDHSLGGRPFTCPLTIIEVRRECAKHYLEGNPSMIMDVLEN